MLHQPERHGASNGFHLRSGLHLQPPTQLIEGVRRTVHGIVHGMVHGAKSQVRRAGCPLSS